MAIRPLATIAAPLCAQLHTHSFANGEAWDKDFLTRLLVLPTTRGVLAEIDDILVGFALWQHGPEWCEVLTLAVLPAWRRSGIARQLMRAMENAVCDDGMTRSVLDVAADNAPAIALYKAMGYTTVATRTAYYKRASGPAVDAVVMEKFFS